MPPCRLAPKAASPLRRNVRRPTTTVGAWSPGRHLETHTDRDQAEEDMNRAPEQVPFQPWPWPRQDDSEPTMTTPDSSSHTRHQVPNECSPELPGVPSPTRPSLSSCQP